MLKIISFLFSIYAFIIFTVLMLLVFPFVIIASLFGQVRGGNMIYDICRIWAGTALFLWGIFHRNYYEAPPSKGHSVIYVFNHISYMDIPVLLKVFRKQNIRVLAKSSIGKVPIFGYIYKKAAVMVDRSSYEARAKSLAKMKALLRKNISIVIAPEGTFNLSHKPLAAFYDGAFKTAIEMQTPIQPVIFLDTFDRLNPRHIFSLTPGRSRAVFLSEIKTAGLQMDNMESLKKNVYATMEESLIRYKASWIKE